MAVAVAPVIENLERSNFISSLSSTREYAERGWGGVELTGYGFPWDRAFEISMEIRLGAFTEPHKALLGIYYNVRSRREQRRKHAQSRGASGRNGH